MLARNVAGATVTTSVYIMLYVNSRLRGGVGGHPRLRMHTYTTQLRQLTRQVREQMEAGRS